MSKIKRFVPKVLTENDTMISIYSTQEEEIDKVDSEQLRLFNNNFVMLSDLKGVQNFEKILKIKSDVNFDLDFRKQKILDKLIYSPPFTRQRLQSILERIWGAENFLFEIYPNSYEVIIDIDTDNPNYYIYYSNIIREVIPANMYLILSLQYTYLYLARNYNYESLETLTYEELSQYSTEGINEIYN